MALDSGYWETSYRDLVDVVRCKDCKYAERNDASDFYKDCRNLFNMAVKNDWFCADGERKENTND